MFGRILGNKKKLEQQLSQGGGSVAWATITDVGVELETGRVDGFDRVTSRTDHVKITVTVQPDNGEPFEAWFRQAFTGLRPFKGWQCKVIYDPNDRSRIAVLEDSITPPGIDHAKAERAAEMRSEAMAVASSGNIAEYVESLKARAQSGELGGVTIVDGRMISPGAPASKPEVADQLSKLASAGYAASDVRLAILSHLRQDHIGGIPYLPKTEFIVADAEWQEMEKALRDSDVELRCGLEEGSISSPTSRV